MFFIKNTISYPLKSVFLTAAQSVFYSRDLLVLFLHSPSHHWAQCDISCPVTAHTVFLSMNISIKMLFAVFCDM